ncbi:MAG: rhodanese-like domain-containing protein [Oscillospiraceae bacterium]|nr:rhodanese-like domain-containing protein [Oscillospiraceae bacterium]
MFLRNRPAVIFTSIAALLIVGSGLLIAANILASSDNKEGDEYSSMKGYVSRYNPGHISSAEAWALSLAEEVILLDVQSEESYRIRHVSGAANAPVETLDSYAAAHLPDRDRAIVCYCFCGDMGGAALSAYNRLIELGYTRVFYMDPREEWTYGGASATSPAADVSADVPSDVSADVPSDIPEGGTVTGAEAKTLREQNPGAILLDVRNQDEYDEKHIDGSVLIPVTQLEGRLSELPGYDTVIIVFCRGGVRSANAYDILRNAGFYRVYDMQIVDNWPEALITAAP